MKKGNAINFLAAIDQFSKFSTEFTCEKANDPIVLKYFGQRDQKSGNFTLYSFRSTKLP